MMEIVKYVRWLGYEGNDGTGSVANRMDGNVINRHLSFLWPVHQTYNTQNYGSNIFRRGGW